MAIPAIGGQLSWAIQANAIGDGDFVDTAFNYYKVRAPRIGMGTIQQQDPLPPEVGGGGIIANVFKGNPMVAGQVQLFPRIEGALGWLLLAALGTCTTTPDAPEAGMYRHSFKYHADGFTTPYMAMRRLVPNSDSTKVFGETGADGRVGTIRLNLPASGPVMAEVEFQARRPSLMRGEGASWVYANASYDDAKSIPVANTGKIQIGGVTYPFTGMQIELVNQLSSPQQTQVVGKYYLEDILVLFRGITVRVSVQWSDPGIYQAILTGSYQGTEWEAIPWLVDTVGQTKALRARVESPENATGKGNPWALEINANRLVWTIDGPPELRGGDTVMFTLTGTVLEPASGDACEVLLENLTASYALPTVPTLAVAATGAWEEGDGETALDATATLTDAATDCNGGFLIANLIEGYTTGDVLSVIDTGDDPGEVGVDSGVVSYGGAAIGTVSGGTSGNKLVVKFNSALATPAAVQAVLRNIAFNNAAPPTGVNNRTIRVSFGNGDGGFDYAEHVLTVTGTA